MKKIKYASPRVKFRNDVVDEELCKKYILKSNYTFCKLIKKKYLVSKICIYPLLAGSLSFKTFRKLIKKYFYP